MCVCVLITGKTFFLLLLCCQHCYDEPASRVEGLGRIWTDGRLQKKMALCMISGGRLKAQLHMLTKPDPTFYNTIVEDN